MSNELQELMKNNPEWYKDLLYRDVKVYIKDNINSASRSFVAIGYYLKYVRDNQLYSEDGYTTIWEFAQGEFSIGKSSASSFMSINDKFSVDGNSPMLLEQYRDFTSSKLAEMLTLSEEQLDQVTPVTTRAEIREMKQPVKEVESVLHAEQEQEPTTIDDLDFTVRTYNCLKRAGIDTINELCDLTEDKVIAIRNVSRKCLDEINEKVSAIGKSLKSDITEIVSIESEYIETVTNETEENRIPDPNLSCKFDPDAKCLTASKESCKRINDDRCMYSSGWDEEDYITADLVETVEADIIQSESKEVKKGTAYSLNAVDLLMQKAKSDYEEAVQVGGCPESLVEKRLIIRDALLDYYKELRGRDTGWYKKPQPELPTLKNNDQRKEFIDTYVTWPIWIDIKETGERYHRYDLTDKVAIVVKVSFKHSWQGYKESEDYEYGAEQYYLLGIKSEWSQNSSSMVEDETRTFYECNTNKSTLVEYLKQFQRKRGSYEIYTTINSES